MAVSDVVDTRSGAVSGATIDGVHVFRGIPFAAPPFGENRLLPPRPVQPWTGVRDATAWGPKCPQPPYPPPIDELIPEYSVSGEDCLNLNIWTPELGSAGLPVMVWIPGGMFEYHATGAAPTYDGTAFARDGVVCVTINYRVGAEGFLYLGPGNANRGILDQIAALEWVRDNIAAFGGDPGNVTIFGESAGALSVGTLMAMPAAEGLFRRAIMQSGAGHLVLPVATAQMVADRMAERLGVEATREAMAAVPVDRMLEAQAALRDDMVAMPDPGRWGMEVVSAMMPWQPVVDGDTLPARPIDAVAAGASAGVDIIVGTNVDENRLFLVPGGAIDHITDEVLAMVIASYGLPVESTLAAYRAAHPGATPGDLMAAVQTDWFWSIPAIRMADAHAGEAATYMYEFAWCTPQFGGLLGACHSLEMAFVFDTLGNATEPMLGAEPPRTLADSMHGAWVAFARSGDPGWAPYDLARRRAMRFGGAAGVVEDPRAMERGVWEGRR